jgi:hypothetical protein
MFHETQRREWRREVVQLEVADCVETFSIVVFEEAVRERPKLRNHVYGE